MTRLSIILLIIVFATMSHGQHHGHTHDHHHGHSHDDHHGHSHDHHDHAHAHQHSHFDEDFDDHHGHAHHGNMHQHGHHEEHIMEKPAHFKYSREANMPEQPAPTKSASTPKPKAVEKPKIPAPVKPQFDENGLFAFMNNARYRVWVYSLGSTILISAAPFFILFLIPIGGENQPQNSPFLKVLLSFASGGLLGDALLHLIPHSLHAQQANAGHGQEHAHGHSHGHGSGHGHSHDNSVGMYVLLGITTFLIIEKLVRIAKGDQGGHGHSHGPSVAVTRETEKMSSAKKVLKKANDSGSDEDGEKSPRKSRTEETPKSGMELRQRKRPSLSEKSKGKEDTAQETSPTKSIDKEPDHDDDDEHEVDHVHQPEIKVAGYLNLAADFAHNFTDGLAVGASFMAGNTVGLVTTLTVLVHEIPHEIGDFAILVQSGCSKKSAMLLQLVTAFGALLGCVISLSTSDPDSLSHAAEASWVLPFTAGGFIYVATVSVIPELLENSGLWQSIKEIAALFVGIGMMVLIAKFE